MLDCFKKQTIFPKKNSPLIIPDLSGFSCSLRPSSSLPLVLDPVVQISRSSQSQVRAGTTLPLHTANPRLRCCPVVLARLLLSFSSTCLLSLGREREAGSSQLQALVQGMPSTAPASGDLPCQSNVPPRPACEVRGLMSEYLWCAKQPIFPYIHSQKQMSNFFA